MMATSYPRRTKPPASNSNICDERSSEPSSTIRIRKRSRDAIPRGAVASRIKFLQSLKDLRPTRPVTPTPKRTREDSRSGYGRRISRRFGNPAIQSAQPDETPQVESRHFFLGLNPIRTNHDEEHALTGQAVRYNRSPGINGQIGQETNARRQYDAASPWGVLSRPKSNGSLSRCDFSADLDVMKENDALPHRRPFVQEPSRIPSATKTSYAGKHSHKIDQRRPKFIDSEASIATTSTIRRQNVRDLFADYGIQRPAGLASREVSQDMCEPKHGSAWKFCHVCSWCNSHASVKCTRCCHHFCIQCKEQPTQLRTTQEQDTFRHVNMSTNELQAIHKANSKQIDCQIEHDPVKKPWARPDPTPLQSRKETQKPPSSPPIKFPDFRHVPNPHVSPRKITPLRACYQEPGVIEGISGRKSTARVKDSPFLNDDFDCPRQSLRLFPFGMQGETSHTVYSHNKNHLKHHRLVNYASTVPSEIPSCDIPLCRATHHGHQPLCHAPPCPRKKPRQRGPEDTENGYIADTSRVDDAGYVESRCNSPSSRLDPGLTPQPHPHYSHLTSSSGPDSFNSATLKTDYSTHDIPEYVECRGYPRTGHARHGSPVSSGVVGECQHCLDDCECEACQNTHHNVRCCVHTDHKTIIHHHHTPKKVATVECAEEQIPTEVRRSQSHSRTAPEALRTLKVQHCVETPVQDDISNKPAQTEKTSKPLHVHSPVTYHAEEVAETHREFEETTKTEVEHSERESQHGITQPEEDASTFGHKPQEFSNLRANTEPAEREWFVDPFPHEQDHIYERQDASLLARRDSLGAQHHKLDMTDTISPRTLNQATRPESRSKGEELLETEADRTSPSKVPTRSSVAELTQRIESKANKDLGEAYCLAATPSIYSKGSTGSKKKNWKLRLVDWNPDGRKKKKGEEHRLSDDEIVSEREREDYKAMPSVPKITDIRMNSGQNVCSERKDTENQKESPCKKLILPGKGHNLSADESVPENLVLEREHDCVWKKRFEEIETSRTARTEIEKEKDMGILGITVLVHLAGREDLIARVKNWTGGEVTGNP